MSQNKIANEPSKVTAGEDIDIGKMTYILDGVALSVYDSDSSKNVRLAFTTPIEIFKGDIIYYFPSNNKIQEIERDGGMIYYDSKATGETK